MNSTTTNAGIDVTATIAKMKPGEQKCYHVGTLMYDRSQEGPWSRMVGITADAVYAAYQRGEVTLAQRRLAPLKYEYLMIRRVPVAVTKGGRRGATRKPVSGSGEILLPRPEPSVEGPLPDLRSGIESPALRDRPAVEMGGA